MNFLNMRYFLAVAQHRSFTAAARSLYISQQSLSAHIAALEQKLELPLFERTNPLTLTHAGEVFLRYAKEGVHLQHSLLREFDDIRDGERGTLRLGIAHTRGRIILPDILRAWTERYPLMAIQIHEGSNSSLVQALLDETAELVIARLPFQDPAITQVPFYQEEAVLLVPDHILEQRYGAQKAQVLHSLAHTVDFSLLDDCPFLLNNRGEIIRTIADMLFAEAGFVPNILVQSQNLETLLEMCLRGLGIILYPRIFLSGLGPGGLPDDVHLFSLNSQNTAYPMGFGYLSGAYLTAAARAFMETARQVIGRQGAEVLL